MSAKEIKSVKRNEAMMKRNINENERKNEKMRNSNNDNIENVIMNRNISWQKQ